MFNRILAVAILSVAACFFISEAEGGKKPKKDDAAGAIEIYKNDAGKYRFRIKNAEGKTIAIPLPQMHWETKAETLKAIDGLKEILDSVKPVEVKEEEKKATEEKKKTE